MAAYRYYMFYVTELRDPSEPNALGYCQISDFAGYWGTDGLAGWSEKKGGSPFYAKRAAHDLYAYNVTLIAPVTAGADQWVQADYVAQDNTWGLVARWSGPGDTNMYLAWFYGTNGCAIYKNVAGVWTLLNSTTTTLSAGITFKFDVTGTNLNIYSNGGGILSASDSSLSNGQCGIRNDVNAFYDNFSCNVAGNTLSDNFNDGVWDGLFLSGYASSHPSPGGETYASIGDGDVNTKWLAWSGVYPTPATGPYALYMDAGSAITLTSYRFWTANDLAGRDPVKWQLYGSNDSGFSSYVLLDDRTASAQSITTSRQTPTQLFSIPASGGAFPFHLNNEMTGGMRGLGL
jgi:hypothetical protein